MTPPSGNAGERAESNGPRPLNDPDALRRRPGSTTNMSGRVALRLLPHPGRIRLRQELARDRERIPSRLLEAMGKCANGQSPWPLFVFGSAGCGKTRGMLYLADRLASRCIFVVFDALCEQLRLAKLGQLWEHGEHDSRLVVPADIWDRWKPERTVLPIIDDLGCRSEASNHVYETLKTAIDTRESYPLAITSNLAPDELAKLFDDRIASRLVAGTIVDLMDAPDMRTEDAR
jgi:hypothetical protein